MHIIHPDDIESPRFGGWADDFNTYEEACLYYGCDTPAQVAAEERYYDMLDAIAHQDAMEAAGGPIVGEFGWRSRYPLPAASFDYDMPF